ncbi:MAG: GHKL domain-containing protein [Anaerotruncus sp.]|jgi:two-component system sensor histidine kinase AgrC|nr:GHKL domain-containing protein [Anaerotruncus sp.]
MRLNVAMLFTILAVAAYHLCTLQYICRLSEVVLTRRKLALLTGWNLLSTSLLLRVTPLPFYIFYLFLILLYLLEFFFLLRQRWTFDGLFLLGALSPFILLCMHGIMIPLMAMLHGINMYELVHTPKMELYAIFWALIAFQLVLLLLKRVFPDEKLRLLLHCRPQLRLACGSMLLLLCYLLIECYVYDYRFPRLWTPVFHMITSMLAFAAFSMVVWYAVDISNYIEYELKTHQVEKQLQRQVLHYQQYTRYINEVRTFKHDYKGMTQTLQTLVGAGANERALDLLGQMSQEMENLLQYTQYSNHVVVDAVLRECAIRCKDRGIAFSALVTLPEQIGMNDLELCRIFNNLVENAYEACERVQDRPSFLRIGSSFRDGWATIELINSFSGEIILEEGQPVTSKKEACQHGLGLTSVRELVESRGGFLQFEVNHQRQEVTVRLHLCTAGA